MDLDLLRRTRNSSAITGAAAAVLIAYYAGLAHGAGWTFGVAWSLLNLYFLTSLVKGVVTPQPRRPLAIAAAVFVKFPVLYLAGLLALRGQWFSPTGLMAGFTWPFFVLTFKGLGRYYLKLDDNAPRQTASRRAAETGARSNGER